MSELALTEPQTAQQQPKPARQRRIPRRIVQAIDLLASGLVTTQKAAAEQVGLSQEHLCRMLNKDHVRVFCDRRARQTIARAILPASSRLVELLHSDSEHVSLDATKHLLGISGIAPAPTTSVNVNVDIKAGYVIDLSATPERHDVSHTLPNLIEQTNNNSDSNDL